MNYSELLQLAKGWGNFVSDRRIIWRLQHMYGIDACLRSLERGKKHFPQNWYLQYSYLDHMHSKYEKIDYEKSWKLLIQIEQYWDKLNLEDQIHYQYNKIALEMYRTGKADIKICKELLIQTFENVLPIETGRIHNLLGQIYYMKNDFISAEEEFGKSLKILKEHTHISYIYVPLVNLTLLYARQDNAYMCLQNAIKTMDYLLEYKKEKITRQLSGFADNIIIEKECASLIVIMEIIQKIDHELFEKYTAAFPNYDSQVHSSSMLPQYYYLNDKLTFRC